MSEQNHTPEPWSIDKYHNFVTPMGPLYLGGITIPCNLGENMRTGWANARRIVACVNACAGYTTEELEHATLDKRHRHEIIADLVKSNKQIDELSAEVEELKLIIASDTGTESAVAALQDEIAAIKQAITDPENQPSQFGTVTYQMFELEKTKRIYWRKKFLARSSEWGVVKKQRDQLLADIDEESAVREKLATLLAETSIALKGPEATLFRHSWHDLAEVAGVVVAQRDELLAALDQVSATRNIGSAHIISRTAIASVKGNAK